MIVSWMEIENEHNHCLTLTQMTSGSSVHVGYNEESKGIVLMLLALKLCGFAQT